MDSPAVDPEEAVLLKIREGSSVPLEIALLTVSGLHTRTAILSYQGKIDEIWRRFFEKCSHEFMSRDSKPPLYLHRGIAKCLFDYLWTSKPKRFGEHFLLKDVLDAQLHPDVHRTVGTCVGLTSLYSVLGLRAGLNLSILVNSDHVLTRLTVGHEAVDIDHTDPSGFDCGRGDAFKELPVLSLVANVLNSRGLLHERQGKISAAKADYQRAMFVNPVYASAYNNRGNMRFREDDMHGAIADYSEAIRLDPLFCEAYCNRGMARHALGLWDEARRDYQMAISLNSEHEDAARCLQRLDSA